jgi:hypothetical protein
MWAEMKREVAEKNKAMKLAKGELHRWFDTPA